MEDTETTRECRQCLCFVLFTEEGRKEDYMYALAKPHGPCRGSSGSDMHKQIKNQNRDIKHPTAQCRKAKKSKKQQKHEQ